jgi:hypothetical protein
MKQAASLLAAALFDAIAKDNGGTFLFITEKDLGT